jgi:hypothetical protein
MHNHNRDLETLGCHWPVERLVGSLGDDVRACIARGWLYCIDIGQGWVRVGRTPAGRNALAMSYGQAPVQP